MSQEQGQTVILCVWKQILHKCEESSRMEDIMEEPYTCSLVGLSRVLCLDMT
jgi:hypothetical protein